MKLDVLWAYLVKKCKPLDDNNLTARRIYNYVVQHMPHEPTNDCWCGPRVVHVDGR